MDRQEHGRTRRVAALLALAAMVGCTDKLGTQLEDELGAEQILETLAPGIHPVLAVAGQSSDAVTVELHLKRIDFEGRIASVQGELRYDAEILKLAGAEIPKGVTGAWNEVEKGTLRFAGVSLEGFDDDAVLSITFETRDAVRAEAFDVAIEEIIGGEGFEDLAPQLQLPEANPVMIRGRSGLPALTGRDGAKALEPALDRGDGDRRDSVPGRRPGEPGQGRSGTTR